MPSLGGCLDPLTVSLSVRTAVLPQEVRFLDPICAWSSISLCRWWRKSLRLGRGKEEKNATPRWSCTSVGQITCLAWFDQIGHQEDVRNVLAFGSGRGLLVMYRQTRPEVCIFLTLCCIKNLMQSLESDGRALNNPCLWCLWSCWSNGVRSTAMPFSGL